MLGLWVEKISWRREWLPTLVFCLSEVVDISPGNLDSSCDLSSSAFCMMYSAYELNKQGDSIQPCHTPFPILNQSIILCQVLPVAS